MTKSELAKFVESLNSIDDEKCSTLVWRIKLLASKLVDMLPEGMESPTVAQPAKGRPKGRGNK